MKRIHASGFFGIFITVILVVSLASCVAKKLEDSNSQKISISIPSVAVIGTPININVEPREPGISNIKVIISNNSYNELMLLSAYPYSKTWSPKMPGVYTVKAEGYSITEGKWYTAFSTLTVYDLKPPYLKDIKLIPEAPYVGDEVLLQLKLDGENPFVDINVNGILSSSASWFNTSTKTSDKYVYLRLPRITEPGKTELFLRSVAYKSEDATKLIFDVRPRDLTPPNISVYADTFYSENSNVSVRIELTDDINLKKYMLTFDDKVISEENISGKKFVKEVMIGKSEIGTHAINVVAYDAEGNMNTYAKRIYIGGTALSFNVQVSPSEPTANTSAVIAMVPNEKNVIYTRIVFLVDGHEIADFSSNGDTSAQSFAIWSVEEGTHFITIYAESKDGRAGIAETWVSVKDYNGPRFVSLKANGIELKKTEDNYVFPGLVTFSLTVEDPGGISLTALPRLLVKEDEFATYYRDLQMEVEEVSPDGRVVTFSVTTPMSLGQYYISVMNVQDKSGNLMRDIGRFLLYVQ